MGGGNERRPCERRICGKLNVSHKGSGTVYHAHIPNGSHPGLCHVSSWVDKATWMVQGGLHF